MERSGARHYGEAGTRPDRQDVTLSVPVVAWDPSRYTGPRAMHLPLRLVQAPALARVPEIRACANLFAF